MSGRCLFTVGDAPLFAFKGAIVVFSAPLFYVISIFSNKQLTVVQNSLNLPWASFLR